MAEYTILGAGLAGISASYHLGHENCIIFEKNSSAGGHIRSDFRDGFTWDQGPHVSFTKNDYVRELFAKNVEGEFFEYPVETVNYFYGEWIPHPAQSNLWAIPQPLRDLCLNDFLASRRDGQPLVDNYDQWLRVAFGASFVDNFSSRYTEKYWTTSPKLLTTDWVGKRVFYPDVEDVMAGYREKPKKQTHYVTQIRYPKQGGYFSFARRLYQNSHVVLSKEVVRVSFDKRSILFSDGYVHEYDRLINTIPLPQLIGLSDAPADVKHAATKLNCSSVLLVDVTGAHRTVRPENWIYVYDGDKYSTRINCTELLSPNNAPRDKTGIQVEVYFSSYKPKLEADSKIASQVVKELLDMGLIASPEAVESVHTRWIPFANVIFDNVRREAMQIILSFLEKKGLIREDDDLEPMTNWDERRRNKVGDIALAGRFGQWKYFWTDDCVLRGKSLTAS